MADDRRAQARRRAGPRAHPGALHLAAFLERRFRSAEEDEAHPRHLDDNGAMVPALALDALQREVCRLGAIALRFARGDLAGGQAGAAPAGRDERVVARLSHAIGGFVVRLSAASMAPESARRLPLVLRVARYYETAVEVAGELARAGREAGAPETSPAAVELRRFLADAAALLARVDPRFCNGFEAAREDSLATFETRYQALKSFLLEAGAAGAIDMPGMEVLLRRASLTRRVVEQAVKAARAVARLSERPHGSEEPNDAADGGAVARAPA